MFEIVIDAKEILMTINWTLIIGIIGAADGAILAAGGYLSTSPACTGTCQSTVQLVLALFGGLGTLLGTAHVIKAQQTQKQLDVEKTK
jgi:hypothetical protein